MIQEAGSEGKKLDALRVKTIYVRETTKVPIEIIYDKIDEVYLARNQMKAWWLSGSGDVYFETPDLAGIISQTDILSVAFEGMPGIEMVCGVEPKPPIGEEPKPVEPKRRIHRRKEPS